MLLSASALCDHIFSLNSGFHEADSRHTHGWYVGSKSRIIKYIFVRLFLANAL